MAAILSQPQCVNPLNAVFVMSPKFTLKKYHCQLNIPTWYRNCLTVGCELNIYANKQSSLILIMRMEKLEIYQSNCFIQKLCLRMHIILNSPPMTLLLKVIAIFEQTAYHLLTGCRLIVVVSNMISEILHHENTLNELSEVVCSSNGWHLISIPKSKMAPNMSNRGMSADLQLMHPR